MADLPNHASGAGDLVPPASLSDPAAEPALHAGGDDVVAEPGPEVPGLVEHLFRHESGKMIATLTRIFGPEHLCLAEDVVQEALARALRTWPFSGAPENPSAWIMRAARNLALDVVRRQQVFRGKEPEIARLLDRPVPTPEEEGARESEIVDDRLRLMFVCCHPRIPEEAQVALALRTLCGFSVAEIASAFLTSDAAIAKRLTRARQRIREERIRFEIPSGEELSARLDGVLRSLYLLFNEGYKASMGERLVREEACAEAIRLAGLLTAHPAGDRPEAHALLALMLLHAARLPARVDANGRLARLSDQDRRRWDPALIARGLFHLSRSASGEKFTAFHAQAGIAACHCSARDYSSTDWRQILALYDRWVELDDSPVVALNRAVAVANVHGPEAGRAAVAALVKQGRLDSYYLLHAIQGEFEARLNEPQAAAGSWRRALELAGTTSERAFLAERLRACEEGVPV